MIKKPLVLIALIILLSSFLRFYRIDKIPAGFFFDEVTVGVNAYFLSQSGQDEFANFLPDFIKIGDDFRHGAIFYATVLFVKLLGVNELAVRTTIAFFGVLIPLITYFLVKALFGKGEIALFSSLLLAISPWLINLSRSANEVILALFFLIISDLLLLMGFQKGSKDIFSYLTFLCS